MTPVTPANFAMQDGRKTVLRSAAEKLEAQFLAEMLQIAGVGKPRDTFGGGVGEDHFSSFLAHEYASATVKVGGTGLTEAIFDSLVLKEGLK